MDKRKNNGGHSTKGAAGRPAKPTELKGVDLASPHVHMAFRTIAEIVANPNAKDSDRISAAKLLIAYGCGNPKDTVESTVTLNNFDIRTLYGEKTQEDME